MRKENSNLGGGVSQEIRCKFLFMKKNNLGCLQKMSKEEASLIRNEGYRENPE